MELSVQEIMLLIDLVNKACLIEPTFATFQHPLEVRQFNAAKARCIELLARLDQEYPGMIPVPHDGISWKDR